MKSKKNLVLLIPSLKRGGAERVVSRLSSLLNEDFNIFIVLFDGTAIDYQTDGNLVILNEISNNKSIFSKFFRSLSRIKKYRNFKKQKKIDITYSFGNTANIVNIYSGLSDIKITSVRGFGNLKLKDHSLSGIIYRNVAKLTLKKSDLIISVSKKIKYAIENELSITPSKIEVIHNGYNVKEINLMSKQGVSIEESKWIENNFIFCSMGSYRYEKGYENLINSFFQINNTNPNTRLIIIGKGNLEEENKIKNQINKLGIEESVYLTGYTSNPYKYLAVSNCFVLSSRTEGFPNALVEAMACGLPIISTDCNTGPREILSDLSILKVSNGIELSEFGILVKPFKEVETLEQENVIYLVEAMNMILTDDNLRAQYVIRSRKRARDFSYEKWKNEHLKLIFKSL